MTRRRPAAPGLRPRGRFAAGWCAFPPCGVLFVIDREVEPWARARTCSDTCRARLGNLGRNPLTCKHCVMVDEFHTDRCTAERAIENGGFRDETARDRLPRFGPWLKHYPWRSRERPEPPTAAAS